MYASVDGWPEWDLRSFSISMSSRGGMLHMANTMTGRLSRSTPAPHITTHIHTGLYDAHNTPAMVKMWCRSMSPKDSPCTGGAAEAWLVELAWLPATCVEGAVAGDAVPACGESVCGRGVHKD